MIKKLQAAVILILLAIVGNGVYNYLKTDRDVVFVGVDGYSAPFSITNPSGELKGFDIDFIKAVSHAVNLNIDFRLIPFNALQDSIKKGSVDIVIAPFRIDRIAKTDKTFLSKPYYKNNVVYVVREDDYDDKDSTTKKMTDFSRVCITDKPKLIKYLRKLEKSPSIMIYSNSGAAFNGLYNNQCDVLVDSKSSASYYITKHNLRSLKMYDMPENNASVYYKIAINQSKPDLAKQIDAGIDYVIQTRQIDKISQKWFSRNSDIKSEQPQDQKNNTLFE